MRNLSIVALLANLGGAAVLPAQSTGLGRIEGVVTDSLRMRSFARVEVRATTLGTDRETTVVTIADDTGAFSFTQLAPGRYGLSFASATLDSLEFGGPIVQVTVAPGAKIAAQLATPSSTTLKGMVCPRNALPAGKGALLGRVVDAESELPLAGAQIAVLWQETQQPAGTPTSVGEQSARVATDAAGQYRLCGLPTAVPIVAQVQHQEKAGAIVHLIIDEQTGVFVRNLSFSAAGARPLADSLTSPATGESLVTVLGGTAILKGQVFSPDGSPLPGARVRLAGSVSMATSNRDGWYTLRGLPAGTHEIEVRFVGYTVGRADVELRSGATADRDVRLERITTLSSVDVVSKWSKYIEFDSHRKWAVEGTFLDEEDIQRRHVPNLTDVILTVNGFRISGGGPDAKIMSSRGGGLKACETLVVVDQVKTTSVNTVPMASVAAMEFYPGSTGAPMQFKSECGTIMIWTKR